jgi:hypothetical protein
MAAPVGSATPPIQLARIYRDPWMALAIFAQLEREAVDAAAQDGGTGAGANTDMQPVIEALRVPSRITRVVRNRQVRNPPDDEHLTSTSISCFESYHLARSSP